MSFPGFLKTFFFQNHQRLVQPVKCIDRRSMMIGAGLAFTPVSHHEIEIQEPGTDWRLAGLNPGDCCFAQTDRRQAGYTGKTLLRTAICSVNSPIIKIHFNATQRSYTVDNRQAIELPGDRTKCFGIRPDASGRFCMHKCDEPGVCIFLERCPQFFR